MIVRCVALVFTLYRNENNLKTLVWIDEYLRKFGMSGALVFESKHDLERAFAASEPVPVRAPADESVLSLDELNEPLDLTHPSVRQAVMSALRTGEVMGSWKPSKTWRNRSSWIAVEGAELQDVLDP